MTFGAMITGWKPMLQCQWRNWPITRSIVFVEGEWETVHNG